MPPQDPASAWLLASCFGLSVASALLPWLNGEAVVVSFAVLMRSPLDLAALALVAAAGQMLGKCVLYRVGASAGRLQACQRPRAARWRERLRGGRSRGALLIFLSSAIGIPPLYLATLAAGAAGMPFPRFVGSAACGRVIRFAAVAFAPGLVLHVAR